MEIHELMFALIQNERDAFFESPAALKIATIVQNGS